MSFRVHNIVKDEIKDTVSSIPHIPPDEASDANFYLKTDGMGNYSWADPTTVVGNYISGPDSVLDYQVPVFDGTTGKIVKNSSVTISDDNVVDKVEKLNLVNGDNKVGLAASSTMVDDYNLTLPFNTGGINQYLKTDGTGSLSWDTPAGTGSGDVNGPTAPVPVRSVAVFADNTGKTITNSSNVTITNDSISDVAKLSLKQGSNSVGIAGSASMPTNYDIILPQSAGLSGEVLTTDGTGMLSWTQNGSGDVSGPGAGVTVNTIPVWSDTTGTLLKATGAEIAFEDDVFGTGLTTGPSGYTIETSKMYLKGIGGNDNKVGLVGSASMTGKYYLTMPVDAGQANQVLTTDGTGVLSWTTNGVIGPMTTVRHSVPVFDNTTGTLLSATSVLIEEEDDNSGFHLEVSKIYLQDGTLKVGLLPNTSMTQSYYLTFPVDVGTANQVLTTDGNTGALSWTSNGTGDVHAPTTGNVQALQVPVFSDTTGTNLSNSIVTIGTNGNVDNIKELSLRNSVGNQRIALHAPPALGASYSMILPNNNGASGEYLSTDGLGNLSWAEPSGSGNVNAPTDPVTVNTIPIFNNTTGTILGTTPIEIDSSQQQIGKVKKLNIQNADNSGNVSISVNSGANSSLSLVLPATSGAANQYLSTDGAGNLNWGTPTGTGSGDVHGPTPTPIGVNTIPIFSDTTGIQLGATAIEIDTTTQQIGKLKQINIQNGDSSGEVNISVNSGANTTIPIVLPSNTGNANQYLCTDGAGVLSWGTPAGTGSGDVHAPTTPVTVKTLALFGSTDGTQLDSTDISINNNEIDNIVKVSLAANSKKIGILPNASTPNDFDLTLPDSAGTANAVLQTDGTGALSWNPDKVSGPGSSVNTQLARFDGATGKIISASNIYASATTLTNVTQIELAKSNGSSLGITLSSSDSLSESYSLKLPPTLGASGQILELIDAGGTLGWGSKTDSGISGPSSINYENQIAVLSSKDTVNCAVPWIDIKHGGNGGGAFVNVEEGEPGQNTYFEWTNSSSAWANCTIYAETANSFSYTAGLNTSNTINGGTQVVWDFVCNSRPTDNPAVLPQITCFFNGKSKLKNDGLKPGNNMYFYAQYDENNWYSDGKFSIIFRAEANNNWDHNEELGITVQMNWYVKYGHQPTPALTQFSAANSPLSFYIGTGGGFTNLKEQGQTLVNSTNINNPIYWYLFNIEMQDTTPTPSIKQMLESTYNNNNAWQTFSYGDLIGNDPQPFIVFGGSEWTVKAGIKFFEGFGTGQAPNNEAFTAVDALLNKYQTVGIEIDVEQGYIPESQLNTSNSVQCFAVSQLVTFMEAWSTWAQANQNSWIYTHPQRIIIGGTSVTWGATPNLIYSLQTLELASRNNMISLMKAANEVGQTSYKGISGLKLKQYCYGTHQATVEEMTQNNLTPPSTDWIQEDIDVVLNNFLLAVFGRYNGPDPPPPPAPAIETCPHEEFPINANGHNYIQDIMIAGTQYPNTYASWLQKVRSNPEPPTLWGAWAVTFCSNVMPLLKDQSPNLFDIYDRFSSQTPSSFTHSPTPIPGITN